MTEYLHSFDDHQRDILTDPSKYIGIATQKAKSVAESWREKLNLQ